jgi:hypothetical protein
MLFHSSNILFDRKIWLDNLVSHTIPSSRHLHASNWGYHKGPSPYLLSSFSMHITSFLYPMHKAPIGVIKRVIQLEGCVPILPLNNLSKYSYYACLISSSYTKRCFVSSVMHLIWLNFIVFLLQD